MLKKIIEASEKFSKKHNFKYKEHKFNKNQLWVGVDEDQDKNWAIFEKKPGVYIITNKDKVVYIGKSIVDTGNRLIEHFQSEEKMQYINEQTKIIVFSFDDDKHFTSALESYLIELFKPILNKQLG